MTHRSNRGLALIVALMTTLTACGGGDSGTTTGAPAEAGEPEKTELTVGVLPLADLAPSTWPSRRDCSRTRG
ncbi:hypothetical protein [Blastococcus brunescens]|uniref:Uncharacterized protein n=1 Tax=Blastococcus brunescens TaxID=1564165 RepID=A0ABZ1B5W1_9ACTN|nr:hypothetical protein [Blastococcus sp. BMG 8361]WRL65243.1 hypothetical protein U6N30_06150 [Blastococcus sp. BMG 8361]